MNTNEHKFRHNSTERTGGRRVLGWLGEVFWAVFWVLILPGAFLVLFIALGRELSAYLLGFTSLAVLGIAFVWLYRIGYPFGRTRASMGRLALFAIGDTAFVVWLLIRWGPARTVARVVYLILYGIFALVYFWFIGGARIGTDSKRERK